MRGGRGRGGGGGEKKRRREEKGKRREEKKNNRAPFREANNYIYKLPINRLSGLILYNISNIIHNIIYIIYNI